MGDDEKLTMSQLVGRNMREVRESRGKVLWDVANAARDLGLTWDASAVSRVETARRDLTLEEFIALPLVMTLALNETVTLSDLLAYEGDETAGSEDAVFLTNFDRRLMLRSEVLSLLMGPGLHYWNVPRKNVLSNYVSEQLDKEKRQVQAKREPDEDTGSHAEMVAVAKEMGVKSGELFDAYLALWDTVTLQSAREQRLIDSGEDLSNPTRVRTLRGHITRQLKLELHDYFANKKAVD